MDPDIMSGKTKRLNVAFFIQIYNPLSTYLELPEEEFQD